MKTYTVTVNSEQVSQFNTEAEAYKAYSNLVLLMPATEVDIVEAFIEERGTV